MTSLIDNVTSIETPEGATLNHSPAGIVIRGLAFLIDLFIKAIIIFIGVMFLIFIGEEIAGGIFLIFFFLISWFYGVLFEILNDGQTPGKIIFNLQVIKDDGTPVSMQASILRNLIFTVIESPLPIVAATSMILSNHFQRIGDHLGKTIVIHADSSKQEQLVTNYEHIPCPVVLSNEEKMLFLEFQSRQQFLTIERNQELANLLKPIHHLTDEEALRITLSYAREIRGSL